MTRTEAAQELNVSTAVIDRVGYVEKHGCNELNDALTNGG
jgi:hypothetical protein